MSTAELIEEFLSSPLILWVGRVGAFKNKAVMDRWCLRHGIKKIKMIASYREENILYSLQFPVSTIQYNDLDRLVFLLFHSRDHSFIAKFWSLSAPRSKSLIRDYPIIGFRWKFHLNVLPCHLQTLIFLNLSVA